jgi:hypothetical protein
MITLAVISILYAIFGLLRFKKLYGHYIIFDEDMKAWTFFLYLAILYAGTAAFVLIVKYLP